MYGAELAATLPFDAFFPALSGFGITGGVGYTKTKVTRFNGTETQIPGYSKFVANLTAFYESQRLQHPRQHAPPVGLPRRLPVVQRRA